MIAKARHPVIEGFMAQLEAQGHKATGARRALARAVERQRGHFTAERICQELPRVGRATIYRNIKLMVDLGLVCRVLLENGRLHYQVSNPGHHHHLICTECGRSQNLLGCDLDAVLQERAAEHRFSMEGHWLEVYGRCQACRSKASAG